MKLFRYSLNRRNDRIKDKLSLAIKEIEIHRKSLLNLKERLEVHCKDFLEITRKDGNKIYETDYSELKNAVNVVNASGLALNQLILRLETLKDLGDVIYHLDAVLKVTKNLGKSIFEILPNLDGVLDDLDSTLKEILIKLQIKPLSFNLNSNKEEGEEFIEKAIEYIEKKNKEDLESKERFAEKKRMAVLTTGESISEGDILSSNSSNFNSSLFGRIQKYKDDLNLETVNPLNKPSDRAKCSILGLLHEEKVIFREKDE
ncbi:MAG: hypothetical protein QXL52_00145 [Nitrososphaerales archaeon]